MPLTKKNQRNEMKGIELIIGAAVLLIALASCMALKKGPAEKPPQTVGHVDLVRYTGKWYEIASYPNRFQKGCINSQATYTLREDGTISVLNRCTDERTGQRRQAEGKAWVMDKSSNAKLKVSFFWPFSGDYWIMDLGEEYEYAVIGHPERKFLWILSRTRQMEEKVYRDILSRLNQQGYDTSRLMKTTVDE
jgi:apolipoprotein D and lipocalin family protein